MSLSVQVYTDHTMVDMLADYTSQAKGLTFGTSKHGFGSCTWFVRLSLIDSFLVYEWPGTPHVLVSDNGGHHCFEGRLEDISLSDDGVQFVAFGYWRALADVPYTALWSSTDYSKFAQGNEVDLSVFAPDKFKFEQKNRLNISLTKNTVYDSSDAGSWVFLVPDKGEKGVVVVSFDYEFNCETNYRIGLTSSSDSIPPFATNTEWSLNGDGTLKTGSQSVTITTGGNFFGFFLQRITSNSTYTGETGDKYARFTNIRIKTVSDSSVFASNVAAELVTYTNGINPGQLNSDHSLIQATTIDLEDAIFEDELPADILDELAARHNYRAAVWEGRKLSFAPYNNGRTWFVDVARFTNLQRSLEPMKNSVYGVYQDGNKRTLRTAVSNDTQSQSKRGIVRRGFVNVKTTSQTLAESYRDAFLTDGTNHVIRASIEFDRLYDENGAEWPLYMLRSDDQIVIRNLPPVLSLDIDNIRSFRVAATEYDVEANTIHIEPDIPVPTLVTLMAGVG